MHKPDFLLPFPSPRSLPAAVPGASQSLLGLIRVRARMPNNFISRLEWSQRGRWLLGRLFFYFPFPATPPLLLPVSRGLHHRRHPFILYLFFMHFLFFPLIFSHLFFLLPKGLKTMGKFS